MVWTPAESVDGYTSRDGHFSYLLVTLPREKDGITGLSGQISQGASRMAGKQWQSVAMNEPFGRVGILAQTQIMTLVSNGPCRAIHIQNTGFGGGGTSGINFSLFKRLKLR